MARLLNWPRGLAVIAYQRLSGPRAVGASSTESTQGFVQTVAAAFGAWRYQLSLRTMRGKLYRRYRGMVTGLHGGANAVRVPFCDPDIPSWEDSGVGGPPAQFRSGLRWSNGHAWSNGQNWHAGRPLAVLADDAAVGDTLITLTSDHWGRSLLGGEWIGFVPLHFGKYEITQVLDDGQYRIYPPLRKALVAGSYATLRPVMAMRLESESAGTVQRSHPVSEGNTLTLVEVQDPDVRAYFAD
jgi:hypothetical protein